jgi:hypothetical protein
MTRLLSTTLARAFSPQARASKIDPQPHFHRGAQGNVAACFDTRCDRPRLEA